jgi:hypothetical protein
LVHLPSWPFPAMVADPSTRTASVTLPIQPEPCAGGPRFSDEGLLLLNKLASGQDEILRRLRQLG